MNTRKHTPLPWDIGGEDDLQGWPFITIENGEPGPTFHQVCWVCPDFDPDKDKFSINDTVKANAEFIIQACHSYYPLLELLKAATKVIPENLNTIGLLTNIREVIADLGAK